MTLYRSLRLWDFGARLLTPQSTESTSYQRIICILSPWLTKQKWYLHTYTEGDINPEIQGGITIVINYQIILSSFYFHIN